MTWWLVPVQFESKSWKFSFYHISNYIILIMKKEGNYVQLNSSMSITCQGLKIRVFYSFYLSLLYDYNWRTVTNSAKDINIYVSILWKFKNLIFPQFYNVKNVRILKTWVHCNFTWLRKKSWEPSIYNEIFQSFRVSKINKIY